MNAQFFENEACSFVSSYLLVSLFVKGKSVQNFLAFALMLTCISKVFPGSLLLSDLGEERPKATPVITARLRSFLYYPSPVAFGDC